MKSRPFFASVRQFTRKLPRGAATALITPTTPEGVDYDALGLEEARDFFGKDSMEGVVMSVNSKDAGGDGLADKYIERFAERTSGEKEAAAK